MTRRPVPAKKRKATPARKPKNPRAPRSPAPPKPKAGRSPLAAAARCAAFAEAYLTNGHNATAAAVAAGCTGSNLGNAGWKLLQKPAVQLLLAARAEKVAELAELNTENWAAELRAVLFSRVGDLYGPDGELVPPALLPRHVQAAISGVTATPAGATKYKFWDKCAALQIVARHLGLFERDNAQQSDIKVRVELVG